MTNYYSNHLLSQEIRINEINNYSNNNFRLNSISLLSKKNKDYYYQSFSMVSKEEEENYKKPRISNIWNFLIYGSTIAIGVLLIWLYSAYIFINK